MSTTTALDKSKTSELSLVAAFQSGIAQPLFPEIYTYPVSRAVNIYLEYLETGNYPQPSNVVRSHWSRLSRSRRRRARVNELFEVTQKIQGQALRQMTAFIRWCGSDDAAIAWATRTPE